MHPEPINAHGPGLVGPTIATQGWYDALFLHWRIEPRATAALLPAGTEPDVFDGSTWVGLIAFRLRDARVWPGIGFGPFGTFVEINVRLYSVDVEGRRAVVFRSLDAPSLPAVLAARCLPGMRYVWAATGQRVEAGTIRYRSRRGRHGAGTRIDARVDPSTLANDPLSTFLTARWALHQRWLGRTLRLPTDHAPWRLHPARLLRLEDELVAAAGLPGVTERPPDSVLYSPGVRARFGIPASVRVDGGLGRNVHASGVDRLRASSLRSTLGT
ncbi:hypothetical protein GCM10011490_16590 [Pseudoclavibacter endophyticus]|uniref:DUF2071 domain-containing protein n=1 Tax=Pseudoclavibacter endophyticus TaxID=1778590 RepID=A0A6H9WRP5_9MICO|nr:DUF2071 domain-containing protein [Pseudoclavibacter endophyticus]KAB1648974.1 DUF2071 domain-containing protein [Pseudoclavibacter endophyticus]GGA66624.1 hypothetical protein GCM10011490_16590 [Pseudoclavibacter endophyticus]